MATTGRATQSSLVDANRPSAQATVETDTAAVETLRERLADPGFRTAGGSPQGSAEAILAMSAPPDYTACPNPFIEEWVERHGRPYDPASEYQREPFAVDVSVGKTDALYRAHGYHTKVPHLAIVPSILHYTEPGDIVLDGFCGSGMTGVAAQWCGAAPDSYRRQLEMEWLRDGRDAPKWGARRAILNDLSPAATFIAANYNRPFDVLAFADAARALLDEVDAELSWMYETTHTDGRVGRIEYTVWSEVFGCPNCGADITFTNEALDLETKRVRSEFPCPECGSLLTKTRLERQHVTEFDQALGESIRTLKRKPVIIVYRVNGSRFEKTPDDHDQHVLDRVQRLPLPGDFPTTALPYMHMTHERARMDTAGVTHVHHFFLARAAHALAALWRKANACPDERLRHMLLYFVEQAIWGMSVLNRYTPTHFSHVNQYLNGVYYVASQHAEVSPHYILEGKLKRLGGAFDNDYAKQGFVSITTGDCAALPVPDRSVDYIFTDPPFGENIYYADLNYLVESWHGVITDATPEAIMDRARHKALPDYGRLMQRCFAEYYRVLKPGRWMSVVFHNSSNAVWNVIQEGMLAAGFVVADVRTLDKQQGSFRQVTSSAVKQDLVISAYKPAEVFERQFRTEAGTDEGAWSFVRQHLAQLPVVVERGGFVERIAERQPFLLFDRMVAFHIQRNVTVPLSAAAFLVGVQQRFTERDGMLFLPGQVQEYDEARLRLSQVAQIPMIVTDEKAAIVWLRQQLDPALGGSPLTYQEIQPRFLTDLRQVKQEDLPELRDMLAQNFLENAQHRWFVPDPGKAEDLEQIRRRDLLRAYQIYVDGKGKLRSFRFEAVRAGFADAYRQGRFAEIVRLAERIPADRLQEDPDMLMYYDNASLRVG